MTDKTPDPFSTFQRRARRLRITGIVVLLLGFGGAGVVYWTRPPDVSEDLSMVGFDRARTRQMEILYGKQGRHLANDLKEPGTQAILIATASVLLASGCFYLAKMLDVDNETN